MRTSWVLFFTFLLIFWQLWSYLMPLRGLSLIVGSVWVTLWLSYLLSRLVWKWVFASMVSADGKAVLITGCGKGFGYRLAKRLSRDGFLVFAGCRNAQCEGAEQLKRLANVKVLQLDVTKQEEVDNALEAVKEHLGKRVLWSVVPNAGIASGGLLEWTTVNTVAKIIDVNVYGVMRVIKKFLPLLKKSQGRVVTVASPLGRFTFPMLAPYCMSKHAVISMMDAFRRECHDKGVDFIIVEPWAYRTPLMSMFMPSKDVVMQEINKQDADVIADFSDREINEWLQTARNVSKAIIREDPEEAVDVIENAVRETHPKTRYQSPWVIHLLSIYLLKEIPDEVADIISNLLRKIQLKMFA